MHRKQAASAKFLLCAVLAALITSACSENQDKSPSPAIGNFDLTPPAEPTGDSRLECRAELIAQDGEKKLFVNRMVRVYGDGQEVLESETESETPC
jgi:hypothetical protein